MDLNEVGLGQRFKYKFFEHERTIYGITYTIPKKPPLKEIANYDRAERNQRFEPPKIPEGLDDAWLDFKYEGIPLEDKYVKFVERERKRRKEGYWFFNNGYLEYMTGKHYFYCAYWKIQRKGEVPSSGLPDWTDADRDHFYFWQACIEDPVSLGMCEVTNRRDGKTWRGICSLYETVSRKRDAHGGIQSKTSEDASMVFEKLIYSWKKLPEFWKPLDRSGSSPSKGLFFEEEKRRGSKALNREKMPALNSRIDFRNAKEEAYDGSGMEEYFADEEGKTVDSNVFIRHNIVKECMMVGANVIGKKKSTTTVEELEKKGGANFKLLWEASNQYKRTGIGTTESGLYRYFKPANYGLRGRHKGKEFIDEFGYSKHEEAYEFLQKRRKSLTGATLASEKRKYPLEEREIWTIDNKQPVYPLDDIQLQLDINAEIPKGFVRRGNFQWKQGERDNEEGVEFIDDSKGRWQISWMPKDGDRNKFFYRQGHKIPGNKHMGGGGVDPYDHTTVVEDGKKSKGSAVFIRALDPMDLLNSEFECAFYLSRPKNPRVFYEDILMACVFYGFEVLVETNKSGLREYFVMRGYRMYLMNRPANTRTKGGNRKVEIGLTLNSEELREKAIEHLYNHILKRIGKLDLREIGITDPKVLEMEEYEGGFYGKCYFDALLEDAAAYDGGAWTKHDAMVAWFLALLNVKAPKFLRDDKDRSEERPMFKRTSRAMFKRSRR